MKNQRRYPIIENAGNIITEACNQKMIALYGSTPHQEIAERLTMELEFRNLARGHRVKGRYFQSACFKRHGA
jgi:hypothetical protein